MGVEFVQRPFFFYRFFMTLDALNNWLLDCGCKPQHIQHIYRAMLGVVPWPQNDNEKFPKKLRERLPQLHQKLQALLTLVDTQEDPQERESAKLLFALEDGQTIESVLLPRQGVCVSSQVGCAVGCVFCMTGKSGLIRQLTDLEIVAQVMRARALRPKTRKVVFMGMGEPSHNLQNVMRAINFLGTYGQFPHKNLVLSTVGDVRVFKALDESVVKPALAISLHTTNEEKRRVLLPKAGKITIETLVSEAERYARDTNYPIQYQWTLIDNLNDGDDEVKRLIELLCGHYAMMNFIPVNVVESNTYRRPPIERCAAMARALQQAHIVAKLRHSAAQEVEGGCGQLRSRYIQLKVEQN